MTGPERAARPPRRWVLWHPHERLWNWQLEAFARRAGRPMRLSEPFVRALVSVDSVLLFAMVLRRRAHDVPARELLRLSPPTRRRVLYVDCGLHKEGAEVRCVRDWFGDRCELQVLAFEASAEHGADAAARLADVPDLDLRQLALVGPDAPPGPVRLYKGRARGRADSLYGRDGPYDLVPADRLSRVLQRDYADWLAEPAVALLVRMNIEGSEFDVVDDLVRSGLHARVDGYFGMWDDVAKRDPAKDRRFRRMLRAAGVRTVTFNDRDLDHRLRRFAIRLALDHAIRRAARREPGGGPPSADRGR